jgi:hypothetical protein
MVEHGRPSATRFDLKKTSSSFDTRKMNVDHDFRNPLPRPEPSSHLLDRDDRWFDADADPDDIPQRDRQLKWIVGSGVLAALVTVSLYAAEALIRHSPLQVWYAPYAFLANGVLAIVGAGAIGLYYRDAPGDRLAGMVIGGMLGLLSYSLATAALCLAMLLLSCPITLLMELG